MSEREYPLSPMVGVGAVVLLGNRALLVRRAQAPLAGEWSLPGGAVELGETLEQAIVREVVEETGLTVRPVKVLKVLDYIERDSDGGVRFHYVLVDFLCRIRLHDGQGTEAMADDAVQAASDVSDVRWASVEGLRTSNDFQLAERTLGVIEAGWREVQKAAQRAE